MTQTDGKRLGPLRLTRRSVRLSFDIHGWLGVLGGLALFICCFTGSLALFERELDAWETPALRTLGAADETSIDTILEHAHRHLGNERAMFVSLPTDTDGSVEARAFGEGDFEMVVFDPASGARIEQPRTTAFEFLTHLHTDLHLPRPYGRYLVGFLGIFLTLSLISGVMAHPRLVKDLFLLRWRPSLRLTFSDVHKQLGVWGLVFGLVMALSGAVIGLLGFFAPVMVLSAFGGDVEKATEAFSGPHFEETSVAADMLPLEPIAASLLTNNPGFGISGFSLDHWGDETAEVSFFLERRPYRALVAGETHRMSLVDGRELFVSRFTDGGIGTRLFGAMQPVHYALFGGLPLKLVYLVSGFALSLLVASGTGLWIFRRQASDPTRHRHLGRLFLGSTLGLVIASAAAVAAGRFADGIVEPVFWSLWGAATLLALVPRNGVWLARMAGYATAVILATTAVLDLVVSARHSPLSMQVDLVLLLLAATAALTAALAGRLQSKESPRWRLRGAAARTAV